MEAGADFFGGVGAASAFGSGDDDSGCRYAGDAGQAYDLPPAHGPRLRLWQPSAAMGSGLTRRWS